MKRVIVLAAPTDGPELDSATIRHVRDAVADLGPASGEPHWLAPARAVDIPLDDHDANDKTVEARVMEALDGAAIDLAVLPAEGRRKKLLVADMDSTVITVECIDELADFAGIKAEIAVITERAMQGELDFEGALRERVARLKGLASSVLDEVYNDRICLTPGTRQLLATMRAHGAHTLLVSGGFTAFTDRVAEAAGFHQAHANTLVIEDDVLTGEVLSPVVGAEAKLTRLEEKRRALGLVPEETMAIGDGANDLPMIRAAGLGVAYRAKPKAAAAARANIRHGDLTTALFFQGYELKEIIND